MAWDHVSWPGNEYYSGARATDDGVKAAATSSMASMTGIEGHHNPASASYDPQLPFRNWKAVVLGKSLQLELAGRVSNTSISGTHDPQFVPALRHKPTS